MVGVKNIAVFPFALSNEKGIMEMYGFGTGASLLEGWNHSPTQITSLVPVSTLDAVASEQVRDAEMTFVLIDVEGAEKYVLEGASSILSQSNKPVWMVEISTVECQPKGVSINPNLMPTFEAFWGNGYESFTADKKLAPIVKDDLESVLEGKTENLGLNNFLFIDSERTQEILGILRQGLEQ